MTLPLAAGGTQLTVVLVMPGTAVGVAGAAGLEV